jgi:hypothetical protein
MSGHSGGGSEGHARGCRTWDRGKPHTVRQEFFAKEIRREVRATGSGLDHRDS